MNNLKKNIYSTSIIDDIPPILITTYNRPKGTISCSGGTLSLIANGTVTFYSAQSVTTVNQTDTYYQDTELTTLLNSTEAISSGSSLYTILNGNFTLEGNIGGPC